jgi:hypothetical protein
MKKILILSDDNPLSENLKGLSIFTNTENINVTIGEIGKQKKINSYDLVISMAYYINEDICSMEALNIFYKAYNASNTKIKFIFLSWYNPLTDVSKYKSVFSADNGQFEIMDTSLCHIIQLPFTEETICKSINKLLNL